MATYIFFWNPDISNFKREGYMETFNNGAFFNWSINEYEDADIGDDFYMIICGNINAVIAKGVINSLPYEANDWSPKNRKPIYYVDMDTYVAVNPFVTDKLLTGDMLDIEIPGFNWHGGHSGRLLDDEKASKLDALFENYVKSHPELINEGAMWDDEWGTE